MRSINKVILIGNLTRDPEMRSTLGSEHITVFGLATNRDWVTRDGRKERDSEFHEIVCFGGLAEISCKRLKKGMLVHIEGHLKTRSWDDSQGLKKFKTEIVAEDLVILERNNKIASHAERGEPYQNNKMQPSITVENPTTL